LARWEVPTEEEEVEEEEEMAISKSIRSADPHGIRPLMMDSLPHRMETFLLFFV